MHVVTVAQAVERLRQQEVIAYPTEAVYGLGCDPRSSVAVERILEIKGRPQEKGMILVAASLRHINPWLCADHREAELARAEPTWPGPVTWVFTAAPDAPTKVRASDGSIAIRLSAHPVVRELCRVFGGAIVSTSANASGQPPASRPEEVKAALGDVVDWLVEGQLGGSGKPSQVWDARTGQCLRGG